MFNHPGGSHGCFSVHNVGVQYYTHVNYLSPKLGLQKGARNLPLVDSRTLHSASLWWPEGGELLLLLFLLLRHSAKRRFWFDSRLRALYLYTMSEHRSPSEHLNSSKLRKIARNFLTLPDDAPEFRTENLWKIKPFPDAASTSSLFSIYRSGCPSLLLFGDISRCDIISVIINENFPITFHEIVRFLENR